MAAMGPSMSHDGRPTPIVVVGTPRRMDRPRQIQVICTTESLQNPDVVDVGEGRHSPCLAALLLASLSGYTIEFTKNEDMD